MSIQRQRATKGLCPRCGELAAPYYLCDRCHQIDQLGKFLKWCHQNGSVKIERSSKDRRKNLYSLTSQDVRLNAEHYRGLDIGQRDRPRLRSVPVDVMEELIGMFERTGRPLSVEEIAEAWVTMRRKSGQTNVAVGLAAIIKAKDKRARKMQRRAVLAGGANR